MSKSKPSPTVEAASQPVKLTQNVPVRDNQIAIWFDFHTPDAEAKEQHERVRAHGGSFAQVIKQSTRNCADQQRAITAVRQAVMWANAAIACKGR